MELTTEYLIFIEKKTANALFRFCDSIGSFKKFLQSENDIKIEKDKLIFKNEYRFRYEIKTGDVKGKEQRYIYLKLISPSETEDYLLNFTSLNKLIRTIVHDSNGKPETLWNDISFFYSQKAYPLIYNIENLMRKLITYFMLTNVGKGWVDEASPKAVKDAIDNSKRKQYFDVLHQVDFKHLSDFLFKEYEDKNIKELFSVIENANKDEKIPVEELFEFMPRSNWDRYFSDIVDCEGDFLNKRWKDLYELRCKVAHNAIIGKNDYV